MRFWIACETSRSNAVYGYCRTGVPHFVCPCALERVWIMSMCVTLQIYIEHTTIRARAAKKH